MVHHRLDGEDHVTGRPKLSACGFSRISRRISRAWPPRAGRQGYWVRLDQLDFVPAVRRNGKLALALPSS